MKRAALTASLLALFLTACGPKEEAQPSAAPAVVPQAAPATPAAETDGSGLKAPIAVPAAPAEAAAEAPKADAGK